MLTFAYLLIYAVAILALLWGRQEVVRFLSKHSVISSAESLEAFKRVARRNMLVTVPYMVMLLIGIAIGLYLLSLDLISGLVLCATANVLFFAAISITRPLEIRTRELPCADPTLAAEYARISRSWLHKLWPDF